MPGRSAEEQLAFILVCMKHIPDNIKPNFEEVGKELGLPTMTCYHRHWGIMKKLKEDTVDGTGAKGSVPATPVVGVKRPRAKANSGKKAKKVIDNVDDDKLEDPTPSKKAKTKKDEVTEDEVEMNLEVIEEVEDED